ncbi:MAG TPA: 30S ribosomal protein S1 [Terriglobales bacterium]|nr:30S ribosomal protein S1 [Terriglobales bacterium]
MEDFEQLLESFELQNQVHEGEVLKGTVLKIDGEDVVVDVGQKSEGVVRLREFVDADGVAQVHPGDIIDVVIEHEGGERGLRLSHEKATRLRLWDELEHAHEQATIMQGRIIERIKGGLACDIGVKAFLPGSQLDVRPVRNIDAFMGQEVRVRIIKLNKKRGNVVVSRKSVLQEEQDARRSHTVEALVEGQVVTGVVKNVTEYGVFVDVGGLDGLLHVSDLSWGRVAHPSEMVQPNDEITVKVLKFDKARMRVSLGFKQLLPDPWADAKERYPVGAHVHGKVVSITDYGCFVELEQGIEGLIHISELSWSKRTKHPSKLVAMQQELEAVVLDVNPGERRMSLSLRQAQSNPWETLPERFAPGSIVEGRVRNLTDFGAFVEIEDGIDGLVHISDFSWTKRIQHPSEVVKKGDHVRAKILSIDVENRRLSLGIRQLEPDAWETFFATRQLGEVLPGRVLRLASFGAFVELESGIEGLCHNSEINPEITDGAPLQAGKEYEFKVIKLSPADKKIGLSLRAVLHDAEREILDSYRHSPATSGATIEEHMTHKRAGNDSGS